MSEKAKCLLCFTVIAVILTAGICTLCWFHVSGSELPLPEGVDVTGYATRLQIGFDEVSGTATHDTVNLDMTEAQVAEFLQLLRQSSYRRTRYSNSVSFDGDVAYTISLAYQSGGKNELMMISILDNELINLLVNSDTTYGYLKITDPDFLTKLQAIMES